MTTTRRFFMDEFKREVVALLESSGRPLEHAREGVGYPALDAAHLAAGSRDRGGASVPQQADGGPLSAGDPSAEVARLKRELDRVRMEWDILKTASIFLEPLK